MTVSSGSVDHHRPAGDALERSTPVLVQAIRSAPGAARPPGMRWTNAEIAAHMYASVVEAEKQARGLPSLYDGTGPTRELDEQMAASVPARDVAVLADLVAEATAAFLVAARSRPGDDPVASPRGTVSSLVGLLATDHHLHGGQLAESAGSTWQGDLADLHAPLSAVLPYAFDAEAARGFTGSYTLRLHGVRPIRSAVVDGVLHCDVAGRTDCTITSDPHTFLRVGIGAVSQLRAALTGKVRVGGRKPWLALATNRLFPPIPHGGVR